MWWTKLTCTIEQDLVAQMNGWNQKLCSECGAHKIFGVTHQEICTEQSSIRGQELDSQ